MYDTHQCKIYNMQITYDFTGTKNVLMHHRAYVHTLHMVCTILINAKYITCKLRFMKVVLIQYYLNMHLT